MGPEGQRFGANANGLHMGELAANQGLEDGGQMMSLHDHGIAARHQHIGHLPMRGKISMQVGRLGRGKLQLLIAHKLSPAKAESAVGMTRLSAAGEEQHRLAILVLHTGQHLPVQLRHVELDLTSRMRIESLSNLAGEGLDGFLGCIPGNQRRHTIEIRRVKHATLGKGQLKNGVVGHAVPVDQLLDHVAINPKGKNACDDPHLEALLRIQLAQLGNSVELVMRINGKTLSPTVRQSTVVHRSVHT